MALLSKEMSKDTERLIMAAHKNVIAMRKKHGVNSTEYKNAIKHKAQLVIEHLTGNKS